jgi:hypothetical protein
MWDPALFDPAHHRFSLWESAHEVDLPALFNPRRHRVEFDMWAEKSYNGISRLFHIRQNLDLQLDFWTLKTNPLRDLFRTMNEQPDFWMLKGGSGLRGLFTITKHSFDWFDLDKETGLTYLFEEPIEKASSAPINRMIYVQRLGEKAWHAVSSAVKQPDICSCFSGCLIRDSNED